MSARRKVAAVDPTITIRVGLFDSGCLPQLLKGKLKDIEISLSIRGYFPPEAQRNVEAYAGQLRACLAAVQEARGMVPK